MADEQQQQPDTRVPSVERQAELEAGYERQKDTEAPYTGVAIKTLGELQWIIEQHKWSDRVNLSGANLFAVNLNGVNLSYADLGEASLIEANLSGANLQFSNLTGADFHRGNLSGADLTRTSLERTNLSNSNLIGADMRGADCNHTKFNGAQLDSSTQLGDITWGGSNLSVIDWSKVPRLGDESNKDNTPEQIARAYRQLGTELRSQGIDTADQFAYRARLWQRRATRDKGIRSFPAYLGSLFLDALAGYGYRPGRTILAYLLVILGFTLAFMTFGTIKGHAFNIHEAIIFSLTSFHGRGFFPGGISLDDPITTIAAIEAVIGLIIEVSFIATFTQRFFGR